MGYTTSFTLNDNDDDQKWTVFTKCSLHAMSSYNYNQHFTCTVVLGSQNNPVYHNIPILQITKLQQREIKYLGKITQVVKEDDLGATMHE